MLRQVFSRLQRNFTALVRPALFVVVLMAGLASVHANSVTLEWDACTESNIAGYNVYRSASSGSGYIKLNGTLLGATNYTDSSVADGQKYYYVCTAVNDSGLESGYSNEVSFAAPANQPPVAVDDAVSTLEDSPVQIAVLANDYDPDGDALSIYSVGQPAFGTTLTSGSQIIYTPALNFFGNDSFGYTIIDGKGGASSATVTVTVMPVNDAPVAVDDSVQTNENTAVDINLVANDIDVDGDSLSIESVTQPQNGTVSVISSSSVRYQPNAGFDGNDSFTYVVSDGKGGTDTGTVQVTVVNFNKPPVANDDSGTVNEDESVTLNLTANDSDADGDPLSIQSVTQPQNGSVEVVSTSTVRYTPKPSYHGSDSFTYVVEDGQGGTDSATVLITVNPVNDPPVANPDFKTTAEDTPVTFNVVFNDTDADGDSLSIDSVSQPQHGTATKVSALSVKYVPEPDFHGTDTFTYVVTDGNGGTDSAVVTMTVTPVNDDPVAVDDVVSTTVGKTVMIEVLSNDYDVDGDTLLVESATQPKNGSTKVLGGTTIRYIPASGFSGSDSFTYVVIDGNGGSATGTVNVTVTGGNTNPVASADSAVVAEDASVVIDVIANDSDADGDPLEVVSVTQGQHGSVTVVSTSSVKYQPKADYHGSDSFAYTISDGKGGSASGSVSVTVTPVNDDPVARDDSANTPQGQSVIVAVLANDSDVDGDVLTVVSVSTPGHGSVEILPDQTVVYTPAPDYSGPDGFSYTISDGQGGSASAAVSVTVTVSDDSPSANDDLATTEEDVPVTINVVANDSDPNGDELTVVEVSQPANGSATIVSSSSIRYEPKADYHGKDSFTYVVSDGKSTDSATVLVTVTSVNDAPVAVDDKAWTEVNTPLDIPVLSNDIDVDGDELVVVSVTAPQHGTAAVNADGTVRYTPDPDYTGPDSFTYVVSDSNGGTDSGGVSVEVRSNENQAPIAVDDVVEVNEDQSILIPVLENDSDPEGDPLSLVLVGKPGHGAAVIEGNAVRYTPAENYNGKDGFFYVVADTAGAEGDAWVYITVLPVNDPPEPAADYALTDKNQSVEIDLLANDVDPDGDTLTISSVATPINGSVEILSDGMIRYTPKSAFVGTDAFEYYVTDGIDIRQSTVTVQVGLYFRKSDRLFFPAFVQSGHRSLENTYVGVGLLNAEPDSVSVEVASRASQGRELGIRELPDPLRPFGQTAFLTREVIDQGTDPLTIEAHASAGRLQGFFMVGDYSARRLDGVGAVPPVGTRLYFPEVREEDEVVTLLQMINPEEKESTRVTLELHDNEGTQIDVVEAVLAPSGSFTGTLSEIFNLPAEEVEGFVVVTSETPVQGYAVVASGKFLAAASAQQSSITRRMIAPHFFALGAGGTTNLRVLNTGDAPVDVHLVVRDDDGLVVADCEVTLRALGVTVVEAGQILAAESEIASGSVELEVLGGGAARLIASVTYSGSGQRSRTTVPLVADRGARDQVFPQVAQTEDGSIFTGLAIYNPNRQPVTVEVEAFDAEGSLNRSVSFDLGPGERKTDLLRSEQFLGTDFHQIKGHLRVRGSKAVVVYAIFGDLAGEFLSTIEGQAQDVEDVE